MGSLGHASTSEQATSLPASKLVHHDHAFQAVVRGLAWLPVQWVPVQRVPEEPHQLLGVVGIGMYENFPFPEAPFSYLYPRAVIAIPFVEGR